MNPFMFYVSNANPDEDFIIRENDKFQTEELKLKVLEVIQSNIDKYPEIYKLNKNLIDRCIDELKELKDVCIADLQTRVVHIYHEDLLSAKIKPHGDSPTVEKIKGGKHVKIIKWNLENEYSLIYMDGKICFMASRFLKTIEEVYGQRKAETVYITKEESKILLDKAFKALEDR